MNRWRSSSRMRSGCRRSKGVIGCGDLVGLKYRPIDWPAFEHAAGLAFLSCEVLDAVAQLRIERNSKSGCKFAVDAFGVAAVLQVLVGRRGLFCNA
eukprot:6757066-Pyramimonas_sp.AAC.1